MFRRNIKDADLGGENQAIVIGDVITGRTKAVPVERCADHVSIRKQNGCRAVPGLHHRRIIMVEVLAVLIHEVVVLPGLRNDDRHRERQIHAVHVEEFERIVEHRRVRSRLLNDRVDLVEILLHNRRIHGLLAGEHSVDVAPDRIDFAVMCDHAVRMRTIPGRCRIGGETGMHDGNRRLIILALQVLIEFAELPHEEHTFIDHRTGGKRTDIRILRALLKLAADDIEAPVEINSLCGILRTADKALAYVRHAVARRGSENVRIRRDIPPAEKLQSLLLRDDLQHAHRKRALQVILREEEHTNAVIALAKCICVFNACLFHRLREEAVAYLQQNSDAVADLPGRIFAGSVLKLFHDMKSIVENLVVFVPVDIDDDADSAGVVFEGVVTIHNDPLFRYPCIPSRAKRYGRKTKL